jgi:hypothetical protein
VPLTYEDLGDPDNFLPEPGPEEEFVDEEDGTEDALLSLSPDDKAFLEEVIKRTILFCEELADMQLRPYQQAMAYRLIESIILADGEEITATWSRQSGKSETMSIIVAGVMVLFPKLALSFPMFDRFKRGVWVGLFAPTDGQSEFIYARVRDKLTCDRAKEFLEDPEIDEKVTDGSKVLKLRSGSFARRQTSNPKAKIEGASYHVIILDEAQEADDLMVRKSIHPMLAANSGTICKIGTPSFHKGDYYKAIQHNKRRSTNRGGKQYHFEYDHKVVSKYNPYYAKFIKKEKVRLGEDSDEFQMSYALKWMLDRGMLITEDHMDYLADKSMEVVSSWHRTPCVAGVDVARVKDSTVVTVCWVDWDHPDPAGYYEHRVLDWLEITNTEWEDQYFQIVDFLSSYNLLRVGVDAQGMGSAVAERLERLIGGRCDVVPVNSDLKNQAERWTHLIQLLQRGLVIYPGHSKARRLRKWKRFRQQMEDAEKVMKGSYMMIQAPDDTRDSHDDYVDSLAIACAMTVEDVGEEIETVEAPWFR